MIEVNSTLWCATEGGLITFYQETGQLITWTNTEGLIENNLTAIAVDNNQYIWMGSKNGYIQRFNPELSTWFIVDDYMGHEIYKITIIQDTLWVGLDIGVSLYLIDKQEVKETYRQLGYDLPVEIPVKDIVIHNNTIWVGTSKGVAHASLDYKNLMDPQNWTNHDLGEDLSGSEVYSILSFHDSLYIATSLGIAEFTGTSWNATAYFDSRNLEIHDQNLYSSSESKLYIYQENQWVELGQVDYTINELLSSMDYLWLGTDKGFYRYSPIENQWDYFQPNSMGGNTAIDVAIDRDGHLVVCHLDNGFSFYNGTTWSNYNKKNLNGLTKNDFRSVVVDQQNNKWLASWGGGVVKFGADSTFQVYNNQNQYLYGITRDEDFVAVSDLCFDDSGTLWILNTESRTEQPLVAVTVDSTWIYYDFLDGIITTYLSVIAVDDQGRKFIGTDRNGKEGVIILDDNGTPKDKTDDPPITFIQSQDGLESEEITDLAVDINGGVWIGTPKGLYYYFFDNVDTQYYLPSENIKAIAIDGANNVWVGTDIGLSFLSERDREWTHFSSYNNKLVSNDINSIEVDHQTGDVYVCTNEGISVIQTPYSAPLIHFSHLLIYPVPFIPDQNPYLVIDNLTWNVAVHIYTMNGFLIRKFSQDEVFGKQIAWDGLTEHGSLVPSGIYLVVAQNEEGEKRVGKFAVIR